MVDELNAGDLRKKTGLAYRLGRFMLDSVDMDGLEGFDPAQGFRSINSLSAAIWQYIARAVDTARRESTRTPGYDARRKAGLMGRAFQSNVSVGSLPADKIVPLSHGRLAILTRDVSPARLIVWDPYTNEIEDVIEVAVANGLPDLYCTVDAVFDNEALWVVCAERTFKRYRPPALPGGSAQQDIELSGLPGYLVKATPSYLSVEEGDTWSVDSVQELEGGASDPCCVALIHGKQDGQYDGDHVVAIACATGKDADSKADILIYQDGNYLDTIPLEGGMGTPVAFQSLGTVVCGLVGVDYAGGASVTQSWIVSVNVSLEVTAGVLTSLFESGPLFVDLCCSGGRVWVLDSNPTNRYSPGQVWEYNTESFFGSTAMQFSEKHPVPHTDEFTYPDVQCSPTNIVSDSQRNLYVSYQLHSAQRGSDLGKDPKYGGLQKWGILIEESVVGNVSFADSKLLNVSSVEFSQDLTHPIYSCCIGDHGIAFVWQSGEADIGGSGISVISTASATWGY